jgi:hypothetical protein
LNYADALQKGMFSITIFIILYWRKLTILLFKNKLVNPIEYYIVLL